MGDLPRVTIVIPVYNGANYLHEAIDSALAQTYPNVEVLVVNDGSSDGGATEAIARSYGTRIRYLAKPNGGVASALNLGLREMTGEYFSWLSHDDVYLPRKVAAQIERAGSEPRDAILYSDYEFIDPAGRHLRTRRVGDVGPSMRVALITGDPVNGCTVLAPRSLLLRAGGFDESLRTIQDYDLWFRLAADHPFVHVPEVLLKSRVHPDQGIRTIGTHFEECTRRFQWFIAQLGEDEIRRIYGGSLASFYGRLALNMKPRGFDEVARFALRRARAGARKASLAERAELAGVALACTVLTKKMKPSYWLGRLRARGRA